MIEKKSFTKEEIENIRSIDLLTYLTNYDPDELIKKNRSTYGTREHSSLTIRNGCWMYWAKRIGGKSALDYFVKVCDYKFLDAANTIYSKIQDGGMPKFMEQKKIKYEKLRLPVSSNTNDNIIDYLCNVRGLARNIVLYYIKEGKIYENLNNKAVVFVNYDAHGIAKYACIRSITNKQFFEVGGSDKRYSFSYVNGCSNTLHIFECVIDLISYQTLLQMHKKPWYQSNYLSLGGVYKPDSKKEYTPPIALVEFLTKHNINKVVIHCDHDEVGRGAAIAIKKWLEPRYEVIDHILPANMDINDLLKEEVSRRKKSLKLNTCCEKHTCMR